MRVEIRHECPDFDSYRAARVKSLFNVEAGNRVGMDVELPIDGDDWRIGLVVGPSGSGKTSIGRAIFGPDAYYSAEGWSDTAPIIDAIAPAGRFDDVTAALSAVGLGTVPAWLRPYRVLSNGERFRADLARIICERPARIVVDEFTSVVDRQIARVGALAFGKAWRRGAGQAVLLSCHYDIAEWLSPDWIYDTATGEFTGRYLRRRPPIVLEIRQTGWEWWPLFEPHHYLKLPPAMAAFCYVAFVDRTPVAHVAFSTRPGFKEARACRLVVMPEWQGMGVGVQFLNAICGMWRRGRNRYGKPMPTMIHTSHPGLAAALRRHPLWTQISASLHGVHRMRCIASLRRSGANAANGFGGHFRAVQGFRYTEGCRVKT